MCVICFVFVCVFAFFHTPPRQTGITKLDDANHAGTARSQVRRNFDVGGMEACSVFLFVVEITQFSVLLNSFQYMYWLRSY